MSQRKIGMLQKMKKKDIQKRLKERLQQLGSKTPEEIESIIYTLEEIAEAVEEVYSDLLPQLLDSQLLTPQKIQELFWEIRDQFWLHIDYHVHDAFVPSETKESQDT